MSNNNIQFGDVYRWNDREETFIVIKTNYYSFWIYTFEKIRFEPENTANNLWSITLLVKGKRQ